MNARQSKPPCKKCQYKRAVIALPLLVVLLAAIFFAVKTGVSDIHYFRAERAIAHWGKRGETPSAEQLVKAQISIENALYYWPENPNYRVLQAQILGWKAFTSESSVPYRAALSSLRLALKSRPAHAHTWALLAEIKTVLGEKDNEWLMAKEKALQFGGHDIEMIKRMEKLDKS